MEADPRMYQAAYLYCASVIKLEELLKKVPRRNGTAFSAMQYYYVTEI